MDERILFENLSTLELINFIKRKEDKEFTKKAQKAFNVFCSRFDQALIKECEIVCKNWGYHACVALEIAENTFKRFLKYPNFDLNKIKVKDIDKGVMLYLNKIANNCLFDYYKQHSNPNPYHGDEKIVFKFPEFKLKNKDDQYKLMVIKKALSTLSEKHKIIYLTYHSYENDGFYLPRDLLSSLKKELNISQSTIRSYKFEANKKINEYLEIHGIK